MKKTLGGDRLGAGHKMEVDLHNFSRATFNISTVRRTTMSAGTIVPIYKNILLPDDTWDIEIEAYVNTHPTIGPLFGSYKLQVDIGMADIRLYIGKLHNNALNIGKKMSQIKLPIMTLPSTAIPDDITPNELATLQVNPSSIISYFGIKGVGYVTIADEEPRNFHALYLLMYWDFYKNYYANKQEERGAVIHTPAPAVVMTIDEIIIQVDGVPSVLAQAPLTSDTSMPDGTTLISVNYTGAPPNPETIMFNILELGTKNFLEIVYDDWFDTGVSLEGKYKWVEYGSVTARNWRYFEARDQLIQKPKIAMFALDNIDSMRENILAHAGFAAFNINSNPLEPYSHIVGVSNGVANMRNNQEGLGLKTYQSDLFNNWLNTEWVEGVEGINAQSDIDVSSGVLRMDSLILGKKIFDMLLRINISGGSYGDWLDAVYMTDRYMGMESPVYLGGLSKEIVFQEVISNAATESGQGEQPLGTLAGKGTLSQKHKGGKVIVKTKEPGIIMAFASITPRLDYSQGNDWDVNLQSIDDLHKSNLDGIGFQDAIAEYFAWWTTVHLGGTLFEQKSVGKQLAWQYYQTAVNQTYGNFAIPDNEMFMTLNRNYGFEVGGTFDVTTYIDPSKFNFIFAQTSLDSMNFWVQIGFDIKRRSKMSAQQIPNL